MSTPKKEDEVKDELLLDTDMNLEVDLDDLKEMEEEENMGHKVQTYIPADDGVDNFFDEQYFDE